MKKIRVLSIAIIAFLAFFFVVILNMAKLNAITNSQFNANGDKTAIVSEGDKPSPYQSNGSPNVLTGRESNVLLTISDETVVVIGKFIPEMKSTASFGTVDVNGDFSLVFGGGHDGYDEELKSLQKQGFDCFQTEYGWVIDVSGRGYSAEGFTKCELACAEIAPISVVYEDTEVVAEMTSVPSVIFSAFVTNASQSICGGFSGAPVVQNGKIVGVVSKGTQKGSREFICTMASVYMQQ